MDETIALGLSINKQNFEDIYIQEQKSDPLSCSKL